MRATRSYDIRRFVNQSRNLNAWERTWYQDALAYGSTHGFAHLPISPNTRKLVADLYGIDEKQQIQLEEYFDSLHELVPLRHPIFDEIMPPVAGHVFTHYVRDVLVDDVNYRTDVGDKPGAPIYSTAEQQIVSNEPLVGSFVHSNLGPRARRGVRLFRGELTA